MSLVSNWSNPQYWLSILYSLPAILLALSFHEFAHAYAAFKCGDPTARNLGRMTLDPMRHLDLLGTLCMIFFRFGWAKPVPVNPRNFKHKRDNVIVSLSGIIANFILSFISAALLFISLLLGLTNVIYLRILAPIMTLNLTLGFFNIFPIPPLDGFQVWATFLPYKARSILQRFGFIILIVLIITGITGWLLNNFVLLMLNGYDAFFALFYPPFRGVLLGYAFLGV